MNLNFDPLTQQLATVKQKWYDTQDPAERDKLSAQASSLRAQGANEAAANLLQSGNILGSGVQYSQPYMGQDYDPYKEIQRAIAAPQTTQTPTATPAPVYSAPKIKVPSMSAEAKALLEEIRTRANQPAPTAEQVMAGPEYASLVGALQSNRDDALMQARAELAARGVLGEGSTPAAGKLGRVFTQYDAQRGELVPQLINTEIARQQTGYQNLVNALAAQSGLENQLFNQGVTKYNAEVPYTNLTAAQTASQQAQAAQLAETARQFDLGQSLAKQEATGSIYGTPTLEARRVELQEKEYKAKSISSIKAEAGVGGKSPSAMSASERTSYLNSLNNTHNNIVDELNSNVYLNDSDGRAKAMQDLEWIKKEIQTVTRLQSQGDTADYSDWTVTPRATEEQRHDAELRFGR